MLDLTKNHFFIKEADGKTVKHYILFFFTCETNGNTYILHSDGCKDESGKVRAYASLYNREVYGDVLVEVNNKNEFDTELNRYFKILSERKGRKSRDESDIPRF